MAVRAVNSLLHCTSSFFLQGWPCFLEPHDGRGVWQQWDSRYTVDKPARAAKDDVYAGGLLMDVFCFRVNANRVSMFPQLSGAPDAFAKVYSNLEPIPLFSPTHRGSSFLAPDNMANLEAYAISTSGAQIIHSLSALATELCLGL